MKITAPGLYAITAAEYHADPCPAPSLSNSIAQVLLDHSPRHAWLQHPRLNPDYEPDSGRRMDLGSIAHALLLGQSEDPTEPIEIIDAADFKTKAARDTRDAARAAGKIPALKADYETAQQMVAVMQREVTLYPEIAKAWRERSSEMVAVWREGEVWARCMIDSMNATGDVMLDYKTVGNAEPYAAAKQLYNMDYHRQEAWYRRGLDAVDPEGRGRRKFYFLFQEIKPPFAVSVLQTDATGLAMAEREIAEAVETWQRCIATDRWPAYPRVIHRAEMPGYRENAQLSREIEREDRRASGPQPVDLIMGG